MNRSARRKMLKVVGIIMVVMLPVMLALWFAQLSAVSEISAQLRTFAELALNKTERVIQQVDLARKDAEKYQGKVCTPYPSLITRENLTSLSIIIATPHFILAIK